MKNKTFLEKRKNIETALKKHPFRVAWYLQNPNIQIGAYLVTPFFKTSRPKVERRLIKVSDSATVAADCWFQEKKDQCPTIILMNGFESVEGESRFGEGIAYKAFHYGYNVIFLWQRGSGNTIRLTKSIGDFFAEDIPKALSAISEWGKGNMYIVSLSLGGWSAMLALGRMGTDIPKNLSGLVTISSPANTADTWIHIEKSPLYEVLLFRKYRSLIKRRIAIDPPGTWDLKEFKALKTKREFFEKYFKTFGGYPTHFKTLDEYFRVTDSLMYSRAITVPTFIIHAQDDPIVPPDPFERPAITENPYIMTMLPRYGSHGCFISDKAYYGDLDRHWAQNRAIEFVRLFED